MSNSKLNKWGNGQGFRVDKKVIKALHLEIGDEVEYQVENDKLVITPIRKKKLLTEDYLISQLSSDSFQDLITDFIPDLIPEEYEV